MVAGYKVGNLTFDELGKLGKLTTSLVGLWSRMEAAWDEAMVNIESVSIFEELEGLVATVKEAISCTVRSSEMFVRQNKAQSPRTEDSPADGILVVPTVVDGAEESQEVGDTDLEGPRCGSTWYGSVSDRCLAKGDRILFGPNCGGPPTHNQSQFTSP